MSNDDFQHFLTREGLMDADWKKMCDNGIGVKAFAELTEEEINDPSLGFSFGGKKILKKVLAQVKAPTSTSSSQKNSSTTSPTEAPTPASGTLGKGPHLTILDLPLVNDEIRSARAKWYYLCLTLQLDPDELDSIDKTCRGNPGDCLMEALKIFLKKSQPKPTWKMIVDALKSPGVGFGMLAEQIQEKYIR